MGGLISLYAICEYPDIFGEPVTSFNPLAYIRWRFYRLFKK